MPYVFGNAMVIMLGPEGSIQESVLFLPCGVESLVLNPGLSGVAIIAFLLPSHLAVFRYLVF